MNALLAQMMIVLVYVDMDATAGSGCVATVVIILGVMGMMFVVEKSSFRQSVCFQ